MCALRKGVNSSIRSSCAVNSHNFASDSLKRSLEVILHCVTVRLALPTGEWRTVVSDNEL